MGNVIKTADKYIGYGPDRFTSAYGVPNSTPWCCIFVWYVFREISASKLFYNGQKVAYCPTAYQWCRAYTTRVSPKEAKAGDIIFFDWNHNGSPDHIGFVEKSLGSASVQTVEGNTNGNQVARRIRYASDILGIFRPAYSSGSKTDQRIVTINRRYRVVNPDGAPMRRGAGKRYKTMATVPYGTILDGNKLFENRYVWSPNYSTGWVPIKEGKTIYLHIL